MEKYFIVNKDSELYSDYFGWLEDKEKVANAFKTVCEEFGIQTTRFYLVKERLQIAPTGNDYHKFKNMMIQSDYGAFKKNCPVSKRWHELVKDIEHFKKPQFFYYFQLLGYSWRERLFNVNEVFYGSINSDGEIGLPDFVTEIKGSEFHKVMEEMEK